MEIDLPEITVQKCVLHDSIKRDKQIEILLSAYNTRSTSDPNLKYCQMNREYFNVQSLMKIMKLSSDTTLEEPETQAVSKPEKELYSHKYLEMRTSEIDGK